MNVDVPDACQALPAFDSLATPPFELTSPLKLSDGPRTLTLTLPALWRCARGATGAISELRPVENRTLRLRPGLAVSIAGPRTAAAGRTATYRVRVHDRRGGSRDPLVSGLWDVAVQGGAQILPPGASAPSTAAQLRDRATWTIAELLGGRTRVLRLRIHVPNLRRRRLCVGVAGSADSARPAAAHLCFRVR